MYTTNHFLPMVSFNQSKLSNIPVPLYPLVSLFFSFLQENEDIYINKKFT